MYKVVAKKSAGVNECRHARQKSQQWNKKLA